MVYHEHYSFTPNLFKHSQMSQFFCVDTLFFLYCIFDALLDPYFNELLLPLTGCGLLDPLWQFRI